MPSRLIASTHRCAAVLAVVLATLTTAATAQAAPTESTLPPANITTTSATLEAQGTCDPGTQCKTFMHWHRTGGGTWYNTALTTFPCSGSSTCSWSLSAPLTGLVEGTTYAYLLCIAEGTTTFSYTCHGPNGATTTAQTFTTSWLPPVDIAPTTLTGTPSEFDMLSAQPGSWTNSPTAYAYQWMDCDVSGANCVNIPGATTASYILGVGDVGHTISVQVTGSNSGGAGMPSTSAPTAVVTSSPTMSTSGMLTFAGNFENGRVNPPVGWCDLCQLRLGGQQRSPPR